MAEEHEKIVLKRQQIVNGKHYSAGAHSVPAKVAEQLRARKDVLDETPEAPASAGGDAPKSEEAPTETMPADAPRKKRGES